MRNDKPLSEPHQAVAAEVRAEMARQGFTQGELARRLGVSQQAVSRRLTGDTPFDVRELAQIAAILRVDVAHFVCPAGRAA